MSRHAPTPRTQAKVAKIAGRQYGIITARQLLECGVSRRMIERRVRSGYLVGMYRGVFRIGPVVAPWAREMAAVLAAGEGAHLGHLSAGWVWKLLAKPAADDDVEILVARRGVRSPVRGGYRVHFTRSLPDRDRAVRFGIPVSTPERTLLDLAARVSVGGPRSGDRRAVTSRDLERAVATAERERLVTPESLRARLERRHGRAGTAHLRRILDREGGAAFTRSVLEAELLDLIRKASISAPETNVRVGGYELDMYWRREKVAVEVDGYRYHRGHDRFEGDRARDSELAARGILVVRFTAKRIRERPLEVISELAQALVRRVTLPPRGSLAG